MGPEINKNNLHHPTLLSPIRGQRRCRRERSVPHKRKIKSAFLYAQSLHREREKGREERGQRRGENGRLKTNELSRFIIKLARTQRERGQEKKWKGMSTPGQRLAARPGINSRDRD